MLFPGGSDNFGRRDIEVLLLIPVLDDKDIKRLLILSRTINIKYVIEQARPVGTRLTEVNGGCLILPTEIFNVTRLKIKQTH